ncbi:hypothetical protein ACQPYH_04190 [Kribbella sp. CA-245084]|uniref:hypothetical protein n=1 Tax=Kribbella sp. CA-245084 TaxID=3239940 RepID=UPI003D8F76CA
MVNRDEKLTTMATKLPTASKEAFEALARRRNVTPSALLRRLVEGELAGRADWDRGEVERSTAEQLELYGGDPARSAAALNLARRLDRDPTAGAANAAQWRLLLSELIPVRSDGDVDAVTLMRFAVAFRRRGWRLSDDVGSFDLGTLDAATRAALVEEMRGRRKPGGVPAYEPAAAVDVG